MAAALRQTGKGCRGKVSSEDHWPPSPFPEWHLQHTMPEQGENYHHGHYTPQLSTVWPPALREAMQMNQIKDNQDNQKQLLPQSHNLAEHKHALTLCCCNCNIHLCIIYLSFILLHWFYLCVNGLNVVYVCFHVHFKALSLISLYYLYNDNTHLIDSPLPCFGLMCIDCTVWKVVFVCENVFVCLYESCLIPDSKSGLVVSNNAPRRHTQKRNNKPDKYISCNGSASPSTPQRVGSV